MEYYESVNGFKVSKKESVDTVMKNISNEGKNMTKSEVDDGYEYVITNYIWAVNILTSLIVWIVCIVALILNIVKKNTGKAIFAGIGLVIPILTNVLITVGRVIIQAEEESAAIGLILSVIGAIIQLTFIILPFIFCFSKDKRKINNYNNQVNQ